MAVSNYYNRHNFIRRHMFMTEVLELLTRLGVSSHLHGSQFLAYAVTLCIQDESYLRAVTTRLYPKVARHFSTTEANVEKSISSTILNIYDRGNRALLEQIAEHELKNKPSNSECLAILSEAYQLQLPCLTPTDK